MQITQKYLSKSSKWHNWNRALQFIDGLTAFWTTIEGDKHPPPAAWPVSPTVTPRGRRRLLQKRFRVWTKSNGFTYSRMLLSPFIFTWKLGVCGRSLQSSRDCPNLLSARLIIFSRFGRVSLTQNGGPYALTRLRKHSTHRGKGEWSCCGWRVMGARFEFMRGRGVRNHDDDEQSIEVRGNWLVFFFYPRVSLKLTTTSSQSW